MGEVVFRRSSYCENGECVEVGWRTSSYSNLCDCVQVKPASDRVWVRDSKQVGASQCPVLSFANGDWAGFLDAIQCGEISR